MTLKKYNIAVVGASGLVGRKLLQVLEESKIKIKKLYLFVSKKSAGNSICFNNKNYKMIELNLQNLNKINDIDFAFFTAGANISKKYVPIFVEKGATVIDNSSQFRMLDDVPLVVPEINSETLKEKKIISNPNCSTIQAAVALAPLHIRYGIKRIIFSTYQAVSGAGERGNLDLENEISNYFINKSINSSKIKEDERKNTIYLKDKKLDTRKNLINFKNTNSNNVGLTNNNPNKQNSNFPHPIFNNVLPHIDVFCVDGYTREEYKMINEIKKILNSPDIKISATAVRVPIFNCHCESVNVEFEKSCNLNEIKKILSNTKGIILLDDVSNNIYPTPLMAVERDEVFVGRIRVDDTVSSGINFWIVADNLRKGAATNAVQILKTLIDLENDSKIN